MINKELKFSDKARKMMEIGVYKLNDAVGCTLGPKGRNVVINDGLYPHVTKDGVSIAKALKLSNKFEDAGLQIVKNASVKTCDDAGDGTTTSVVLAQSIISNGLLYLNSGVNPNVLNKQIDEAVKKVIDYINTNKKYCDTRNKDYEKIATISANNDEEIGELVGGTFSKLGTYGVMSIETSRNLETTVEFVEGLNIDRGYVSPYFVNNSEEMKWEVEKPIIICYKGKLSNLNDIIDILEKASEKQKPILIIVDDIESTIVDTLVMNKLKHNLNVCVIKSPYDLLFKQCVEYIVGANPNKTSVGGCDKVIVTNNNTAIINGHGSDEVRKALKSEISDEVLLAKIFGGAAIIKVGAASEIEMIEKKDRIEDALCAVRAASEEGIITGGGYTYAQASKLLNSEIPGEDIIKKALIAPLLRICYNAGIDGNEILPKVLEHNVYNAKEDKFESPFECDIFDPVKVSRVALQNAASVAKMFLTTECVICNE